jgi:sarcosine oxidase subunit alpha
MELAEEVEGRGNCRVFTGATAFAWYDEGILAVAREGELWEMRPRRVIVATGSYENPMIFKNNDLPGIFLAGGLQRLMHRDFIRPGNRAVVVTINDTGYVLARQLTDAGVAVAGIVDNRPEEKVFASSEARKAKDADIAVYPQHEIEAALGRRYIKGVQFKPVDAAAGHHAAPEPKLACDVLCIAGSRIPANELIFQRTSQGTYLLESPHQFTRRPVTSAHMKVDADMYVAGHASGSQNVEQSWLEGKLAGLSAALDLGCGTAETEDIRDRTEAQLSEFQGG